MSQGIAETAVNVLVTLLEVQQLLAGSAAGLPLALLNLCYMKLGQPLDLLDLLNLHYMKQSLQVESVFGLLPSPIFCAVCSFMASLSML